MLQANANKTVTKLDGFWVYAENHNFFYIVDAIWKETQRIRLNVLKYRGKNSFLPSTTD